MEKSLNELSKLFNKPINEYSPLVLAFVGDAVYELFIRSSIIKNTNASVNTLHNRCVEFVNAASQSDKMDLLMDVLTDEEIRIFKRGRNSKTPSRSKSTDIAHYRKATGFETLLGHLFVTGNIKRIMEIMEICIK